jgi:hypothetical protein
MSHIAVRAFPSIASLQNTVWKRDWVTSENARWHASEKLDGSQLSFVSSTLCSPSTSAAVW